MIELTDLVIQGDAIWLLGAVTMLFSDKHHFWAVVGVGANSKHAPLLIKRELVKAHWTYETENNIGFRAQHKRRPELKRKELW